MDTQREATSVNTRSAGPEISLKEAWISIRNAAESYCKGRVLNSYDRQGFQSVIRIANTKISELDVSIKKLQIEHDKIRDQMFNNSDHPTH